MSVCEFLLAEHFVDPIHQRIYAAIKDRIEAGKLADALTLKGEFENTGILDEVGGSSYLVSLLAAMVGIINAGDYGRVIYETWVRRQAIDLGELVVNAAFDTTANFLETATNAATALDALTCHGTERSGGTMSDAMKAALDAGKEAYQRKLARQRGELAPGVTFGLPSLDEMFGELEGGTVTLLAGDPGDGKSVLALQAALYNAKNGVPVHLSSTEMRMVQLGRRALSHETAIPTSIIKKGDWTDQQGDQLGLAASWREEKRHLFEIEDAPALDMKTVRVKARAFVRKHPNRIGLLVIDHMHDLGELAELDLLQAIRAITSTAKNLTKETGWPVLMLAQLTRGASHRESKEPQLTDLYGGRMVEAIAEAVIMLHRPERYLDECEPERKMSENDEKYQQRWNEWEQGWRRWRNVVQAFVRKNRDDQTGVREFVFDKPGSRFREKQETEVR